jgi:hypothetical protein
MYAVFHLLSVIPKYLDSATIFKEHPHHVFLFIYFEHMQKCSTTKRNTSHKLNKKEKQAKFMQQDL